MPGPDLPREAAELLRDASDQLRAASSLLRTASRPLSGAGRPAPETLDQLVRLAASEVSGCSGASATLWQDGEPAVFATSHPDLAELATIERGSGRGPVTDALATGRPVCSPDTLDEDRWPAYAAAALSLGVRCSVTLVHQSGPVAVTLSLFGARPGLPGQPGPADQPPARPDVAPPDAIGS